MKKYYLAYGSNLNIEQMRFRCPDAVPLGTAEIPDYRLLFRGSKTGSYLTIEPQEGAAVPVAVWEVSPTDEARLDRYEGYPNFYYKTEMEITYKGIRSRKQYKRKAFVYIMHEDRPAGIPSRMYMNTCQVGYRDFGFDTDLLEKAVYESWEEMQHEAR